jgi:hypothetical protein
VDEFMGRMLLYVPRMFTEKEFKELAATLPADFKSQTSEFWSYVEEKLHVFSGKIHRVYRDGIFQIGEEALTYLYSIDPENHLIVEKLIKEGAVFEATEDSLLLGELESWLEMAENEPTSSIYLEFSQKAVLERDAFVSNRIGKTLLDGELGILFMNPNRRISFDEQAKIIKVCRFDPADYLRSWQIQLKSEK